MKLEHTSTSTPKVELDVPAKPELAEVERLARLQQVIEQQEVNKEQSLPVQQQAAEASREQLEQALVDINAFIKPIHGQKISFEMREDVDKAVAFVKDKQTGEVIRQIPSEEVLKIQAQIKALQAQGGGQDMLSLLSDFKV